MSFGRERNQGKEDEVETVKVIRTGKHGQDFENGSHAYSTLGVQMEVIIDTMRRFEHSFDRRVSRIEKFLISALCFLGSTLVLVILHQLKLIGG